MIEDHYLIPKDFDVDDYLGLTWGILREIFALAFRVRREHGYGIGRAFQL
jgi:hypothetical protein